MSFAALLERVQKLQNPYPGLRPFDIDETHLFFGRNEQIAELVSRLTRSRLVAVIGVSGSGKSSLVRAGLIPAMKRNSDRSGQARYRVVVMQPAGAPFQNLARKLGTEVAGLRESSHGLLHYARQL